jgi:hypothetical protein
MTIRERMRHIADDLGLDLYDAHTTAVVCAFAWQEVAQEAKSELANVQQQLAEFERRQMQEREQ